MRHLGLGAGGMVNARFVSHGRGMAGTVNGGRGLHHGGRKGQQGFPGIGGREAAGAAKIGGRTGESGAGGGGQWKGRMGQSFSGNKEKGSVEEGGGSTLACNSERTSLMAW